MDIWTILMMNRILLSMIILISSTLSAQAIDIQFKGAIVKSACDIMQKTEDQCSNNLLNNQENTPEDFF